MAVRIELKPSRQAAWIVNISKHLSRFEAFDPGLSSFDNILFAGRCGSLLIKLSADETEQLGFGKVKAHGRICGIDGRVLKVYLDILKAYDCLDWDRESNTFEVLPFGRLRVLETTSSIFNGMTEVSDLEKVLPELLEYCLLRPRLESEVKEYLSPLLIAEEIEQLLVLIERFQLLGVIKINETNERLYFNGYQFGERAEDIGKALLALPRDKRNELSSLIEQVMESPGVPQESVKLSQEMMTMAIGLGLVEVSEVTSPAGSAKFLTMPNLAPPSVGYETSHLEDDVFHHTKMFLSSLKFGELRSTYDRGKLFSPPALVKRLLNNDRVGPCTAIGEDYTILEAEGVIRTIQAKDEPGRQFHMELRRREPAEMVLGLLETGTSKRIDTRSLPMNLELPLSYKGPEASRPMAALKATKDDPDTINRFLEEIRT